MSQDDQIILSCDESGVFTGKYFPKDFGHTGKGSRHFAIAVLLYNKKGEVLLQQRKHKIFDDVWDFTGATHLLHLEGHDESFEESTHRCLEREYNIPLNTVSLKNLGAFNYFSEYIGGLSENEHCALLIGEYNGKFKLNPEVGYSYRWVDKGEFLKDINQHPEEFSPWAVAGLGLLNKYNFFTGPSQELTELLSIVNEKNKVISRATRKEVYAKGLLHRAVNVVLKNSHGQIYLQQRSKDKQAFPLYWDISCSEHLKPGETYTEAAKRGLKEELGIEAKVKRIKPQHRQRSEYKQGQETIIENELVETYEAIYNGKLSFDPREVAAGNFFSKQDILKMLSKNQFTPWFIEEWEDMVKTV